MTMRVLWAIGGLALLMAPDAGSATLVTAGTPSFHPVAIARVPSAREAVALRIGIAADSFNPGRHILIDVPAGPAFVAQLMRSADVTPTDDGLLWFDAAVPSSAFNSTEPTLTLRFLLDEGCKPGEAVPPGRMPLKVAEIRAQVAPLAD